MTGRRYYTRPVAQPEYDPPETSTIGQQDDTEDPPGTPETTEPHASEHEE